MRTALINKEYNALKVDDLNNKTYRNKKLGYPSKTVLHEYGYGYVWRPGEKDACLKSIKRRMLDNYYQTCYSEINNSSTRK